MRIFAGIFCLLFIFRFDYRVGTGCVEICDKILFFRNKTEGAEPEESLVLRQLDKCFVCLPFFSINLLTVKCVMFAFTIVVYLAIKENFISRFFTDFFTSFPSKTFFYGFWRCFEGLSKSKQTKIRSWFMCTLLNLNKFASYRSHTGFAWKSKNEQTATST